MNIAMHFFFLRFGIVRLLAIGAITLCAPTHAQQSNLSSSVRVEGVSEIVDTLRNIETTLLQIQSSQWEYRFLQRNVLSDIANQIKTLGLEGWELVAVTVEEGYIFKRQITKP